MAGSRQSDGRRRAKSTSTTSASSAPSWSSLGTNTARDSPSPPPSTSISRSRRTASRRTRHCHSLDPAFILSPVTPPSTPTTASPILFMSVLGGLGGSGSGHGMPVEYSEHESENGRPRRAASSPQLVRMRGRSDSASSSASLTATEENYARVRHGGVAGSSTRGRGSAHMPPSASTSRFPTNMAYPPLWTFAAAAGGAQPVSPTSPDSSEAATSPDDEEDENDSDEGDLEGDDDDLIFVSHASSSTSLGSQNVRNRRGRGRKEGEVQQRAVVDRVVTTARGQPCAGETETELDELPIRLPTSRRVNSRPVVPLLIDDILVPFLFQVTRFLSIVPATFGTLYSLYHVYRPPPPPAGVNISEVDYVLCVLWAILTGFQCLFLTTGLLSRWKAYYATVSTLIRLVALQCICWPATHLTLVFFDHTRRPVACWALIGTTTCFSRSVQLWVTSNLYMPVHVNGGSGMIGRGEGKVLRGEGRVGRRRWDWNEVLVKCAVPAGVLYFVTAWGMILKEEISR